MMVIIKCVRCRELFSDYLDKQLRPETTGDLEAHIRECTACAAFFRTFRQTVLLCRQLPSLPVSENLHNRVMDALREEVKPPSLTMHLTVVKIKKIKQKRKEGANMLLQPLKRRKEGTGMVDRRELAPWGFDELDTFRSEFDRMFDRFFGRTPARWAPDAWAPEVDVIDEEHQVQVKAVLPGVDKKNLDVKVSGDLLTITGKTDEVTEDKGKNYYLREVRTGAFRREIPLPAEVEAEQVNASYKNGVLKITLPKVKEARAKEVEVKVE